MKNIFCDNDRPQPQQSFEIHSLLIGCIDFRNICLFESYIVRDEIWMVNKNKDGVLSSILLGGACDGKYE